ncbi:odorant receptor coreceptor isoform X1 [Lucilia cuprina]|uniref:odorant receptor coreceptor isoform X1 n=1 Tax=Lucilia cuprina TaxID=7375 RepID=UPI001F061C83|nr:odorant receptor coreceptor isoform X1 [Lucilia cuprina]
MQSNLQPTKYVGLVADLMPNIKLMKYSGLFMHAFTGGSPLLKKVYSSIHLVLILAQFMFILVNMALNADEVNELSGNTITALFFTHCVTKFIYLAVNQKNFYRTLNIWNQVNTHPLFAESDARYHSIALAKMRKLFFLVMLTTVASAVAWITITFFGESVKFAFDKETNSSITVEIPRLPIKSFYPWDASQGIFYTISFAFQGYYLLFSMVHSNLCDVLFCSWLIFACEQLQHLKGIMKPLMELSASLDTYRPNSAALFRSLSANSKSELIINEEKEPPSDLDMTGIYSTKADWGAQFRAPTTLQTFNGVNGGNPNGLTKKQEMMVRSAIKYWVERHKHVVRVHPLWRLHTRVTGTMVLRRQKPLYKLFVNNARKQCPFRVQNSLQSHWIYLLRFLVQLSHTSWCWCSSSKIIKYTYLMQKRQQLQRQLQKHLLLYILHWQHFKIRNSNTSYSNNNTLLTMKYKTRTLATTTTKIYFKLIL